MILERIYLIIQLAAVAMMGKLKSLCTQRGHHSAVMRIIKVTTTTSNKTSTYISLQSTEILQNLDQSQLAESLESMNYSVDLDKFKAKVRVFPDYSG